MRGGCVKLHAFEVERVSKWETFFFLVGERSEPISRVFNDQPRNIIGERAKRARHSQVCSIENRIYIITRKMVPIKGRASS